MPDFFLKNIFGSNPNISYSIVMDNLINDMFNKIK